MVVDPVHCELVSSVGFPANREFSSELSKNVLLLPLWRRKNHRLLRPFSDISLPRLAAIFLLQSREAL